MPKVNECWCNGLFQPVDRAAVSPLDRGFLYGDGVFETLRAEHGRLLFLEDHLARLAASAEDLRISPPAVDWAAVAGELLRRNGLERGPARLKFVLTRGPEGLLGLPRATRPTACVLAEAYRPPSAARYAAGCRARVSRTVDAPALARHKSLNYLACLWARQEALNAGDDEALLLDPSGRLAEAAAGALLYRLDGRWWTPSSPRQLSGITRRHVAAELSRQGLPAEPRATPEAALARMETLWVLNTLVGIMPVATVGGVPLPDRQSALADRLRRWLLTPPGQPE